MAEYKVPLKVLALGGDDLQEAEKAPSYAKMIKDIISRPAGGQGMTVEKMRKVIAICDIIDEAVDKDQEHVILKSPDFRLVSERVKAHPFGGAHKAFLTFVDDILDAEKLPEIEAKDDEKE